MEEFQVPGEPEELWSVDSELQFKVEELVNYDESPAALGEATESE